MAKPAPAASGAGQAYMTLYNIVQFCGWSYILYLTAFQEGSRFATWKAVELPLKVFQTAAILEVVHSAVGLVRAPIMTTAMQVASRIWVLWGIVHLVPGVTEASLPTLGSLSPTFTSLVVAWCLSEIIRYGFFAAKALGVDAYPLLWLRYTGFLMLYPIGVSSELTMTALALDSIRRQQLLSVRLPNSWNFAFDYYIACVALMVIYLPGFPHMFFHMVRQRKKNLGGNAAASRKKAV